MLKSPPSISFGFKLQSTYVQPQPTVYCDENDQSFYGYGLRLGLPCRSRSRLFKLYVGGVLFGLDFGISKPRPTQCPSQEVINRAWARVPCRMLNMVVMYSRDSSTQKRRAVSL